MRLKLLRIAAYAVSSLYEGIVYFSSFGGPILALYSLRHLPVLALFALALAGFWVAGLVFMTVLVLTRKMLGSFPTGDISAQSPAGQRWFLGAVLLAIIYRSPFRSWTCGLSIFAPWFYRGMGARMPDSTFLGQETLIRDPWFLELGEHVSTGSSVLILGHIGHNRELFLGKITVGDDVVIGVRSIIFPDVQIGTGARIGAGSIVVRGTRIPPGETWAGIPARKLASEKASARTTSG
jgi:acetyltransferase-like isoleucine patch superfamily enzyme